MKEQREAKIIQLAKDGDRTAMETLYRENIGYLTAVCSRYLFEDEDVKDILQNSFIKIFSSLDKFQFRGEGSIRAWMSKLVVNQALHYLRDSRKEMWLQNIETLPESAEYAEDTHIDKIPAAELQKMIRRLPDLYRIVFNLYVFSDMSHKQISVKLNIAEGTSASAFHRAKKMLSKMIKSYLIINNLEQ